MHRALFLILIAHGGCAKRDPGSLVLQGKVADEAGPMGERGCPWKTTEGARLEGDTLWLDDKPWTLGTSDAVEAFSTLLAVCGHAHAIRPLRDWYQAERDAEAARSADTTRDSLATVGAALVAGAAVAAAGPSAASPEGDALAHAMRDQNLEPIASPTTRSTDPGLEQARAALIDALTRGAPDDPAQ